jgi:nicotinate-nucleotide adenylyltransferase
MRLGLFGGTFDPIHRGHLDVAGAARQVLPLDEVWLLPARVPPHRRAPMASADDRLAMARLAAKDAPGLAVSDLDMASDGPSYTDGTLDRLEKHGIDLETVFFITGADAFREIATWRNYPRLLDRCHFVVVSRRGSSATDLPAALPSLAGRMLNSPCPVPPEPSIFLVDAPTAPVSSTEVRRRAAEGRPLDDLVPPRVAAYVVERGLYRHTRPSDR